MCIVDSNLTCYIYCVANSLHECQKFVWMSAGAVISKDSLKMLMKAAPKNSEDTFTILQTRSCTVVFDRESFCQSQDSSCRVRVAVFLALMRLLKLKTSAACAMAALLLQPVNVQHLPRIFHLLNASDKIEIGLSVLTAANKVMIQC